MATKNPYSKSPMNEREETSENEDYESNKQKFRGHAPDSRFDEGSTDHVVKVVRPSSTPRTIKAESAGKSVDKKRYFASGPRNTPTSGV
jgi:hypothetical protein